MGVQSNGTEISKILTLLMTLTGSKYGQFMYPFLNSEPIEALHQVNHLPPGSLEIIAMEHQRIISHFAHQISSENISIEQGKFDGVDLYFYLVEFHVKNDSCIVLLVKESPFEAYLNSNMLMPLIKLLKKTIGRSKLDDLQVPKTTKFGSSTASTYGHIFD